MGAIRTDMRADAGLALPLVLITMTVLLASAAVLLDQGRVALRAGREEQDGSSALYVAEAGLQEAVARLWGEASAGTLGFWSSELEQPVQACFSGEGCMTVGFYDLEQLSFDAASMTVTVRVTGKMGGRQRILRAELTVSDPGLSEQRISVTYLNW